MNESQRQARRASIRAEVAGHEIKGLLLLPGTQLRIPFILWDISDEGLGLWVASEIAAGNFVSLMLSKPTPCTVKGEVVWCRPSQGKPGFDCGLRVNAEKELLATIYKSITKTSL